MYKTIENDTRIVNSTKPDVQIIGGHERKYYPYEPLPRSGLRHPYVQKILIEWTGNNNLENLVIHEDQYGAPKKLDSDIETNLATLRTWWQHRRQGETKTAIECVLNSTLISQMVDGYTKYFFTLAHCIVIEDGEAGPKTLDQKVKEYHKQQRKKNKKRKQQQEDIIAVAAAQASASSAMRPAPKRTAVG